MRDTIIETNEDRKFDFSDPRAEDIDIQDIARALSNTCRYGGHVTRFYSVAEHACLVRRIVVLWFGRPDLGLAALHHDSHEAYVGDIPTPMKEYIGPAYQRVTTATDRAICECFGIDEDDLHNVHINDADRLALRWEAGKLKESQGISDLWEWDELPDDPGFEIWRPGLTPVQAKWAFLAAHREEIARA